MGGLMTPVSALPGKAAGADRDRILLVASATAALAVSQGPIGSFTFGLFIKPLNAEFGWDRASRSAVHSVGALIVGLALPFAGAAVDRFDVAAALPLVRAERYI